MADEASLGSASLDDDLSVDLAVLSQVIGELEDTREQTLSEYGETRTKALNYAKRVFFLQAHAAYHNLAPRPTRLEFRRGADGKWFSSLRMENLAFEDAEPAEDELTYARSYLMSHRIIGAAAPKRRVGDRQIVFTDFTDAYHLGMGSMSDADVKRVIMGIATTDNEWKTSPPDAAKSFHFRYSVETDSDGNEVEVWSNHLVPEPDHSPETRKQPWGSMANCGGHIYYSLGTKVGWIPAQKHHFLLSALHDMPLRSMNGEGTLWEVGSNLMNIQERMNKPIYKNNIAVGYVKSPDSGAAVPPHDDSKDFTICYTGADTSAGALASLLGASGSAPAQSVPSSAAGLAFMGGEPESESAAPMQSDVVPALQSLAESQSLEESASGRHDDADIAQYFADELAGR